MDSLEREREKGKSSSVWTQDITSLMVFSTSFAHWSHTFVDGFHLGSSAGTLIAVARASQYRVFVLPNCMLVVVANRWRSGCVSVKVINRMYQQLFPKTFFTSSLVIFGFFQYLNTVGKILSHASSDKLEGRYLADSPKSNWRVLTLKAWKPTVFARQSQRAAH